MVMFSEEAKSLHASDIREILKVTENPEIISFAGGFRLRNYSRLTK